MGSQEVKEETRICIDITCEECINKHPKRWANCHIPGKPGIDEADWYKKEG